LSRPCRVMQGESEKDMTVEIYDMEIREVHHDLGYWIINQSYWYPDNKYTEESAKEKFLNRRKELAAG